MSAGAWGAVKRRRWIVRCGAGLSLWVPGLQATQVTESDAAAAIRVALERGALSAVSLLGKTDGFLGNPKVRIPLPDYLEEAASLLRRFGQSKRVDELVTGMNRAAEQAVPEAKTLLVQTAKAVTVDDAIRIVRGSETSVTEYFAAKTRQPIGEKFLPIVKRATEKVALADKYNAVAERASRFGLVKPEDADLNHYVSGKALDGLYLMIG
ncbi:MAG TPA: DUF4197 domain-containing protein, partial [Burkholderiaceae bacterium]